MEQDCQVAIKLLNFTLWGDEVEDGIVEDKMRGKQTPEKLKYENLSPRKYEIKSKKIEDV